MSSKIYEFKDYVGYLKSSMRGEGALRGTQSLLAKFLSCQSSFVSQVFTGRAHFSLEQGIKVTDFLGMSDEERRYFMLLLNHARSGSQSLSDYFMKEIISIQKDKLTVRSRIRESASISEQDETQYYSDWLYSAAHICSALSEVSSTADIAKKLKVDIARLSEAMSWLEDRKLVSSQGGGWAIGERRLHLTPGSLSLSRHHTNWRLRAIESLTRQGDSSDFHYSGVFALSRSAKIQLAKMLLDFVASSEQLIMPSAEEDLAALSLDLFTL